MSTDKAMVTDALTRPIIGIENRTAQETFDIMCDRIRRSAAFSEAEQQPVAVKPQCCMCGKKDLSTVEGDGGTECQLPDRRWVCGFDCWNRAMEPPAKREAGEAEAARIGDAVLSWLVKYDLADAGNEYRAEDVVAILNDLAPYEEAAEITRLQKELETAREGALEEAAKVANRKWQEYQGPFGSQAASACGYEIETAIRALKDKEVAG